MIASRSAKIWEVTEVVVARGGAAALAYANRRAQEIWSGSKSPQAILDALERGEPLGETELIKARDRVRRTAPDGSDLGAYRVSYVMWASRVERMPGALDSSEAQSVISARHAVIQCDRLEGMERDPDAFEDEGCERQARALWEAEDIASAMEEPMGSAERSRL